VQGNGRGLSQGLSQHARIDSRTIWEISANTAGLQAECEPPRHESGTLITTSQSSVKTLSKGKVGHMLIVPWRHAESVKEVAKHSHRRY
jgi:hypothetical protein